MQLHIRGQQTHVLEVQPSETIETIKVRKIKSKEENYADTQLVLRLKLSELDLPKLC